MMGPVGFAGDYAAQSWKKSRQADAAPIERVCVPTFLPISPSNLSAFMDPMTRLEDLSQSYLGRTAQ